MTLQPARRWWAALTILCMALLAPLLVVDVPPLLDYPNHLARAFVLAALPNDPILARFYEPHWSIIPNLALDLITPPLLHILPVYIAGRLLIAAAILLPVLGTIAYNTALGGRYWSLGASLVAYNDCLLYGFLNFEIALGLALLLAAAWLRWRETHPRRAIAIAIPGAPILFACHLMGLIFFALLIGSAELFQLPRTRASIARRTLILASVFAIPAALYALSDLRHLGGDATFLPMDEKLLQLVTTFVNYNWPLDVATACCAIALPVLGVLLRWGRVPGPAAIAIVLLLVVFLAAPFGWKGTFLLDTRFAIMLGFMLFAGFVPANVPTPIRRTVTAALILLFAARLTLLTAAWFQHRTDLADLRTALAPIRPGQAIYVAEAGLDEAKTYWHANHRLLSNGIRTDEHLGALILIEHRAYWPFQFDNTSQQPIETREPYRTLANKIGSLPNRTTTAAADLCGFDDVLLTAADAVPDLPPGRFHLLARSGYAALYAITACKPTQ
jgi:hypothetical protein